MKFFDEINIYVASGNGGHGVFSFSKNKYSKYKTADGGNGGNGGNVYITGSRNNLTFYKLKFKKQYKAEDGTQGKKNCKNGKNGKDLHIDVPIGTLIYDNERKTYLGEIKNNLEKILVAKGGRQGYGNSNIKEANFKNNLKLGGLSEIKFLHLELFLIAHIGLIGMPNSGKSSLINKLSKTSSKVSDYPFTTISPILGVIKNDLKETTIIADIPGIIKFASKGKGLGFNFLKHISKTELLCQIIDINTKNELTFFKNILIINNEIKKFNNTIIKKNKWLIINKIDLINSFTYQKIKNKIKDIYTSIHFISAKKKNGIKKLNFNIKEYFLKNRKYV